MPQPTRNELIKRIRALEKQPTSRGTDGSDHKMGSAFQIITEQSPNMVFINKRGRVVYVNRLCTQEMGYSKEELCSPDFNFMTLIAPESVDLVRSNFEKHMQGQEVAPYEYYLITKTGKKIAAIITTKLIRYQGETAILGIITDISERKDAEEELQYRLKFQNLVTRISSQFINLHPAQIDDEIDNTLQQIGEFVDADSSYVFQFSNDHKTVTCTHEWLAEGIETRTERIDNVPVETYPWGLKQFLNREKLLIPRVSDLPPEAASEKRRFEQQGIQSILAVPMIMSGNVIGFIGLDSVREPKIWAADTSSLLDIVSQVFANALENKKTRQALTESEERLRTVYETFPDPVTIIKVDDGRCIDVNSAFTGVTGWSATEVIGKTAADLDLWENPDEHQKLLDGISHRGKIENLEARFRLKDGRTITALMSAVLIHLNDRPHILTITRDISELKSAQQEREQLKTQLIQAQKMEAIGTLAGGIAHDFNNILGAIIGYAEMALYDTRPESMEHYNIDQVLKASHRAKDLVKQILAFSRKSEQNKQIISLTPIVKEALNLLRASLPTTIEIEQNIEPNLDAIYADPTQIHQVMMNLCANAGHAMADRTGILSVNLQNIDLKANAAALYPDLTAGSYVRLSVGDTGHGMDTNTMARIFDPYFTTKAQDKGTGMGLAVVHGIIRGHGGNIYVESTPGKGSQFDILFPIMERQSVSETEELKALPTGNECILLVDDEDSLIDLGTNMLKKLGYRVKTSIRPVEALDMFRAEPDMFDLIISDMTMPNMTGDILSAELRQIRADIPIIICTGYSEGINEQKARALGIQGLIMKPFTIRRLANSVRNVLDQKG